MRQTGRQTDGQTPVYLLHLAELTCGSSLNKYDKKATTTRRN